jgi:type I restriction enzyme S subunit
MSRKWGLIFQTSSSLQKNKDDRLRKGRLNRGDIVLTTRGTIGNVAIFDDCVQHDVMRINSGMVLLRNYEKKFSLIISLN